MATKPVSTKPVSTNSAAVTPAQAPTQDTAQAPAQDTAQARKPRKDGRQPVAFALSDDERKLLKRLQLRAELSSGDNVSMSDIGSVLLAGVLGNFDACVAALSKRWPGINQEVSI